MSTIRKDQIVDEKTDMKTVCAVCEKHISISMFKALISHRDCWFKEIPREGSVV